MISPHTVGRRVSNVFDKLGVTHRADALPGPVRSGLVAEHNARLVQP